MARQGRGFKGVARGEHSAILHRYMSVNRWKPIELSEHPYDLELCDLCVRECPIAGAITMEKLTADASDKRRLRRSSSLRRLRFLRDDLSG